MRGRELTQQRKLGEALAELNEAIRLNPSLAAAYNARGYVYLLLRDYTRAVADFDAAIRLNPRYANAYHNRGVARRALGDWKGASKDFAREKAFTK
ncbi:MAG: tetratricopeptide repeat protein [Bryobacteraceae bacterium]|nr:tetratricopeptide repeat protein [Bryobacteraceae bacterium]